MSTPEEALPILKMTVADAIAFADEWSRGLTIYAGAQGWRVVCMLLADEVRRLQAAVAQPPDHLPDAGKMIPSQEVE